MICKLNTIFIFLGQKLSPWIVLFLKYKSKIVALIVFKPIESWHSENWKGHIMCKCFETLVMTANLDIQIVLIFPICLFSNIEVNFIRWKIFWYLLLIDLCIMRCKKCINNSSLNCVVNYCSYNLFLLDKLISLRIYVEYLILLASFMRFKIYLQEAFCYLFWILYESHKQRIRINDWQICMIG